MNDDVLPAASQKKPRNWMQRNWKWFIPLLVVASGTVMATFFVFIFVVVFNVIKSSDAYKEALARVQTDPAIQAALGTPIKEGLFVTGSINTSGSSGEADIAIPISGPYGKATVYAVATKSAERWTFIALLVEVRDTGEIFNLLE